MAISNSALRTCYILDIVSKKDKGATLSEIVQELEAPISSVNDIVQALLQTNMLEVLDERNKVYGVGFKSFLIGRRYVNNTNILEKAMPIIDELAKTIDKTIFLGRAIDGKLTYIYKQEPENSISSTCAIGSQTDIHSTSLGKAIMAFNPTLADQVTSKELNKKTEFTITDPVILRTELDIALQQGYAIDNRENDARLFCIGAPIFNMDGSVDTAISISGLVDESRDIENEIKLLTEKAAIISKRMGFIDHRLKV